MFCLRKNLDCVIAISKTSWPDVLMKFECCYFAFFFCLSVVLLPGWCGWSSASRWQDWSDCGRGHGYSYLCSWRRLDRVWHGHWWRRLWPVSIIEYLPVSVCLLFCHVVCKWPIMLRSVVTNYFMFGRLDWLVGHVCLQYTPSQKKRLSDSKLQVSWLSDIGACTLRHGIQNSMEAILACRPALSTEWLGWVAISCEVWCMRTSSVPISFFLLQSGGFPGDARADVRDGGDVAHPEWSLTGSSTAAHCGEVRVMSVSRGVMHPYI